MYLFYDVIWYIVDYHVFFHLSKFFAKILQSKNFTEKCSIETTMLPSLKGF